MDNNCCICRRSLASGDVVHVTRGLTALSDASKQRQDGLEPCFQRTSLDLHKECRKNYTRPSSIKASLRVIEENTQGTDETQSLPRLRSSLGQFLFKRDCMFCGQEAFLQSKVSLHCRPLVSEVRTFRLRDTIRRCAVERDDEDGQVILTRIDSTIDLVAAEARYHRKCYSEFCYSANSSGQTPGRPEDTMKAHAFALLCDYLDDDDDCQYALSELHTKMNQFLNQEEGYTVKHLKNKLADHYGKAVTMTELPGKRTIFSFRDTASNILYDNWYKERQKNMQDERKRIVETAAAIIREDIQTSVYNNDMYPSTTALEGDVPVSLRYFIDGVIKRQKKATDYTNRKCISIMQAIIAATRPRSYVPPILLSLAVYMHRKYGSKDQVNMLHSLGFSSSYLEVERYEFSILEHGPPENDVVAFLQFVFDNADFNIFTLDGYNTFHSMGGIKCVTPTQVAGVERDLRRILTPPKADVVASRGKMHITTYKTPPVSGLQRISVKEITKDPPQSLDTAARLDALWGAGCALGITPRQSWNGFMQTVMQREGDYQVSDVHPIPFINMDPNNLSTIYTAIKYASTECAKANITTCFVTYDQPLYIKASQIVASSDEFSNVVVRLGGFHLMMSFMGSIGNIMAGSGLEELWNTIYAKASTSHMLTGHAYARAVRAHFLTQEALVTILLQTTDVFAEDDKVSLRGLYEALLHDDKPLDEIMNTDLVENFRIFLLHLCQKAKETSRTGRLWIQYFEQVSTMRMFIRAERTGDWELHLHCIRQMLPYFHAAGHLPYAKSAHLYVQQMEELASKMPEEEYDQFTKKGFFTIRRTDKFWSGVWSDMTIEQVLMRAIKTSGGLTRGRGITDSTLTRWVLALPLCVPICNALEEFAGLNTNTSEQHKEHKESRPAQQKRDSSDLNCLIEWLKAHPPFEGKLCDQLVSLSTGIVADDSINCDVAATVGQASMEAMVGTPYADIKLKRKDKVKSIAAMKNTVKVHDEEVTVNPQQLFNRIACTMNSSKDLPAYMKYELAPQSPSLFDDMSMRRPKKADLAKLLQDAAPCGTSTPDDGIFVIDGGHLLHKVIWPRPATYNDVCTAYTRYILKHYCDIASPTVVFDGYGTLSTKIAEQKRRAAKTPSADIIFTESMTTTTTQEQFLTNENNKSRLIEAVSKHLYNAGINVEQAPADADTLIVSTALKLADGEHTITVVGTDTDLLVMMVARAPPEASLYMIQPGTCGRQDKVFNIRATQQALGDGTKSILFMHAMTGCDTTSALYNKGKATAHKRLKSNGDLIAKVAVFNDAGASKADVCAAGEKFLLILYGGERFATLDECRYFAYTKAISIQSVSSTFNLATLPPTSAAAQQHSLRTYLQVQQWLENDLPPIEYGWKLAHGDLVPVATELPPAPEKLLKMISCTCKKGCKAHSQCNCRRAQLPCSAMCKNCLGLDCTNTQQIDLSDEDQ